MINMLVNISHFTFSSDESGLLATSVGIQRHSMLWLPSGHGSRWFRLGTVFVRSRSAVRWSFCSSHDSIVTWLLDFLLLLFRLGVGLFLFIRPLPFLTDARWVKPRAG
jgi:hypothetical protein